MKAKMSKKKMVVWLIGWLVGEKFVGLQEVRLDGKHRRSF